MFGLSPANLDWLCSFYCFEQRRDTVKAHIGPGWEWGGAGVRAATSGLDDLFADANEI